MADDRDRTRSIGPRTTDVTGPLRLIVFCGGTVTSHVLPQHGEVVIGRGDDALVRIDHATVSRKHATIMMGPTLTLTDHGSFNGTSVGGKKLTPNTPTPLGLSTIAELGETIVVVQVEGAVPVQTSRSLSGAPKRDDLSPGMQHLFRLIENVAQSNITVIVRGETGSGKEVVSEEIHKRSARAAGPLVKLNCAALPEQLLEGELFGYERGAFTGATNAKAGLIEAADGGTLFLDEVGEMPLATQAKLLRVVESREVMRLGSLRPKKVDVRFVAATHRDLEEMVSTGALRQDLYYRLAGVSLVVPPLRERVEEIPRLTHEFIARFCADARRPAVPISDSAMAVLKTYAWPGNVRELRNVIERAVVFSRGMAIAPDHLGLPVDRTSRPPSRASVPHPSAPQQPAQAPVSPPMPPPTAFGQMHPHPMQPPTQPQPMQPMHQPPISPMQHAAPHDPAFAATMMGTPGGYPTSPMPAHPQAGAPDPHHQGGAGGGVGALGAGTVVMGGSLPSEMEALERQRILDALARCGGNQTQAAEMLGISRRTLLRRLDEYAVPRPRK